MIEKHQQTNGIGRGKITINPEYIKRAREITVGGLPVKILSSNPNTGRVLAQFPDGHTEEVKAAPDYFIGGNTSTKELKNNLPIYGETNTAANEKADSLDEAHDLTPIFSNLITAGQISTMNEGALDLLNGKYLEGTTKLFSPAMFGSGIGGIAARSGIGGYNLFNKNGVRKTYNLFNQGHYGEGTLSLLGDAFNTAMATEGLGSISNALKGTSGYRNWRLANAINKGVKENAVITAYNRNPVAKDIGNLWDYQSYLDNVFPNSKVKYVLWHGSRSKNLETFNTNMIGSHMPIKNSVGMYLTPERYIAVGYGTRGSVYPVLLNTENPFITNQFFGGISKNGVNVTKISPKVRRTLLANNDAVIAPRRGEIAFFDPDNALILGSNRDMLGFQKFMKSSKPNIEVPNPTKYNISDNITLYRANPTNIKNPSYKGERYGDTSGLYVGKWFTDVPSKPNWYASNIAKGGEEPAYYLVTVPKYWAEQQKASKQISNPRIEFEPEDYIIEDGIQGLRGQLYQGRPGTVQYLQQNFKTPKLSEPSTSLKFFERPQSKISEAERLGIPKGERNLPFKQKLLTEHTQGEEAVKMFKEYGGTPTTKGKPNISITADAGTTTNQGSTALSLEEILKAFNQARQWHLNRINSPGYTNRALRAGFTEEEIPLLQLQLTSLINRLKLINPEELFKKVNIKHNHNYNGKVNAGYWKIINNDGKLLLGIKFDNPNMSYDDAVSTFVHEFGHGATFGLNGNETTGYMKLLSDLFPLLTRAVKYNKTLYPEVNENIVTQVMPKVGNNAGYYAAPTEMLSRGYEFMRDYANNFFKLKNSEGLTTQRVIDNAANTRINSKIFRALTGNLGAFNFLKYALGTSIPVGLGYSLINNNDNLEQQLQSLKQGGKMNMLEFLKNGSGIHIKKKNRGKFTKYCHGKVTDECIRKAKASGNPTLVKRATFAANARKWKHKEGGKAFVNGVNVLDSNPKMYKYNKKYKMAQEGAKLTFWLLAGNWIKDNLDSISTIGNGISNLISAKNRLDEINLFALAKQKELKAFKYKTWKDKYLSNLQNQTDRSDIVNAHNAFNLTNINDALQEKLNEINSLIANLLYLNDLQDTGLGDITSGLLGIATNILLGTAKKKKIDNTFSPLANQTMSLIRGKLLDINANFSE